MVISQVKIACPDHINRSDVGMTARIDLGAWVWGCNLQLSGVSRALLRRRGTPSHSIPTIGNRGNVMGRFDGGGAHSHKPNINHPPPPPLQAIGPRIRLDYSKGSFHKSKTHAHTLTDER